MSICLAISICCLLFVCFGCPLKNGKSAAFRPNYRITLQPHNSASKLFAGYSQSGGLTIPSRGDCRCHEQFLPVFKSPYRIFNFRILGFFEIQKDSFDDQYNRFVSERQQRNKSIFIRLLFFLACKNEHFQILQFPFQYIQREILGLFSKYPIRFVFIGVLH